MTVDPVGAHTVLGVLASLRGNAGDVRYHNDIALQQSGRTADTLNNYSVCLLQIGYRLNECRELRAQADYEIESDFASRDARLMIEQCERILGQVDALARQE